MKRGRLAYRGIRRDIIDLLKREQPLRPQEIMVQLNLAADKARTLSNTLRALQEDGLTKKLDQDSTKPGAYAFWYWDDIHEKIHAFVKRWDGNEKDYYHRRWKFCSLQELMILMGLDYHSKEIREKARTLLIQLKWKQLAEDMPSTEGKEIILTGKEGERHPRSFLFDD